jgi:hypothetical protein
MGTDHISTASVTRARSLALALLLALAMSVACAIISYLAAGATLGLLIGSITFATLLAPPLAVSCFAPRTLLAIAITVGNVLVWIVVFPFADLIPCATVLFVFTLATLALRSAPIAIIVAFAWLSLPFWMRDAHTLAMLAPFHPIVAMNGACKSLGIWTQQPILYRLTTLGQDVPYELPSSIWRCVIAHGVIGLLLLLTLIGRNRTTGRDGRADRQTTPTPPPAPPAPHTP